MLRAIVDGHQLGKGPRELLVYTMVEFAIHSVAAEADDAAITPDPRTQSVHPNVAPGHDMEVPFRRMDPEEPTNA